MKIDVYTLLPDRVKEYIAEEISEERAETVLERGDINLEGYFDEDDLKLIAGSYEIGEA